MDTIEHTSNTCSAAVDLAPTLDNNRLTDFPTSQLPTDNFANSQRRLDDSCIAAHLGERAVRGLDADASSVYGSVYGGGGGGAAGGGGGGGGGAMSDVAEEDEEGEEGECTAAVAAVAARALLVVDRADCFALHTEPFPGRLAVLERMQEMV